MQSTSKSRNDKVRKVGESSSLTGSVKTVEETYKIKDRRGCTATFTFDVPKSEKGKVADVNFVADGWSLKDKLLKRVKDP